MEIREPESILNRFSSSTEDEEEVSFVGMADLEDSGNNISTQMNNTNVFNQMNMDITKLDKITETFLSSTCTPPDYSYINHPPTPSGSTAVEGCMGYRFYVMILPEGEVKRTNRRRLICVKKKMKDLLLVTIIVTVTSINANISQDVDAAWNNFKLEHGKEYKNLREEMVRKSIFVDNFNTIVGHTELFNQGLVTFSLKINEYADMSAEEFRATHNGYRKSKMTAGDIDVVQFVPDENVEVPDEFDWREKGAVTPIKNQGSCGSCWAFSSTGALEGQYFLKTGQLISISEQNLVDCSHEHNNIGCSGGDMTPSFTYVHDNDGIDSEEAYPYEGTDGECRYNVNANVTSTKGYAVIENGNEEFLKAAVATVGPISVGIDASVRSFHLYAGGIYYEETCSSGANDPETELDHAVLVVGYGTEDGQDYWLVKNSWGTTWGEEGYIKMARNRNNNCGVAAEATYPLNY
ncbi:hypothetical protein NQ318_002350 [Aromia moschata]|uniref:Cathepsin L n=1 Tax=Aromia moschata TaxID=1265417 RepID=A0AAV8X8G8_9CUCU|nr:hypothetical protein NQ318_002350 [Aromia moschata]